MVESGEGGGGKSPDIPRGEYEQRIFNGAFVSQSYFAFQEQLEKGNIHSFWRNLNPQGLWDRHPAWGRAIWCQTSLEAAWVSCRGGI